MNSVEVLQRAKTIIKERGWWNGKAGITGECIVTALAKTETEHRIEADRLMVEATGVDSFFHLAHWNDDQESEKAIFDAFDRAIALAEAKK